ncbi:hypothetical protein [Hymenobacter nivis]|nr:hypothetical protein [Hymenobacter nivis]
MRSFRAFGAAAGAALALDTIMEELLTETARRHAIAWATALG